MKKFTYVSLSILFISMALIIVLSNIDNDKIDDQNDNSQNLVKVLNDDVVSKYFDNKEDFIFVMGLSTCEPCKNYKENTLPLYLKDNNELPLYFAFSDQSFESRNALLSFTTKYSITYEASPTTYIVKNGEVVAQLEGYQTIEELYNFLNNFISANCNGKLSAF